MFGRFGTSFGSHVIRSKPPERLSSRPSTAESEDTLGAALRRRLLTVVACCILGVVGGLAYLALTPKKYVAASRLIVEQVAPTGGTKDEGVVEAQAELVRSRDVLRLADRDRSLGSLPSLASKTDPVPEVQRNLRVEAQPRRNVIVVTYASTSREDAVRVVDLVVEAYRTYSSDERSRRAEQLAGVIRESQGKIDQEIQRARDALAQFDASHGNASAVQASTQRSAGLADAFARAQLDTFAAKKTYDDAVANAGPALAGLSDKQLEEALQGAGSTVAADSGEIVAQEVQALARQLAELRRTYAENHPAVIRATQRLQQMRLAQVAGARQRWQAAQAREASLQDALDKMQRDVTGLASRSSERARLVEELNRAQGRREALDRQLNEVLLSTAAGALNVRIDTPAEIDPVEHPPLPQPAPTLATAAAIGLVLGGLFALIGEFRDAGSLRHVGSLRSTLGSAGDAGSALKMRVLANIPAAESDEPNSPADLVRSSHSDPFGPIANAVRTMRLAMEIDGRLPATVLLTAAGHQQGTTTIAANLAMTIAKENRRVLLVDLNFHAPIVASLLGVDAAAGLAELIDGGEPLELIKPTAVPRLDLLPPGMPRVDTGTLLNDDRFVTLLTMLGTAYDHVIFDAPPLSDGDDARIVASLCDGTVLVSKSTSASLRRAAGARDLLLMVGANLLGVAVSRGKSEGPASSDTLAGAAGSGTEAVT